MRTVLALRSTLKNSLNMPMRPESRPAMIVESTPRHVCLEADRAAQAPDVGVVQVRAEPEEAVDVRVEILKSDAGEAIVTNQLHERQGLARGFEQDLLRWSTYAPEASSQLAAACRRQRPGR
jgi:hypothetical protein